MPIKNKEKKKEYDILYYQKTKEDRKEYDRLKYLNNKETIKEQVRLYQINNKEKIKEHNQTDKRKKSHRISQWKIRGIFCFDWNLLYDVFVSTKNCEFCNVELTIDKKTKSTTRCLDHDHSITDRFNIRGVLCHSCNNKDVFKQTTTNSL